ncbi:MAG: DUF1624 domain-containing protein [Methanimicrococcus sp.]|nr:DUF1624 domain-containing protein [Methanimicrococcus sp.]
MNLNLFQTKSKSTYRHYEIDVLRGIAVILMLIYHFCFDLDYFGLYAMPSWFWPQRLYGFPITIMFIFIAGVSLSLSASVTKDAPALLKKLIKRGAFIFLIGLIITAVIWIYPHDGAILFGVLHLIGVSTILAIPFLIRMTKEAQGGQEVKGKQEEQEGQKEQEAKKEQEEQKEQEGQAFREYNEKPARVSWATWFIPLLFGIIIILVSNITGKMSGPVWMAPFVHPDGYFMLDYEPLFPWFGVILIGVAVGAWLYPKGERRFSLGSIKPLGFLKDMPPFLKPVSFMGRHSLVIYLAHQPVILGILWLVRVIESGLF